MDIGQVLYGGLVAVYKIVHLTQTLVIIMGAAVVVALALSVYNTLRPR